jgi:hypothetical protein
LFRTNGASPDAGDRHIKEKVNILNAASDNVQPSSGVTEPGTQPVTDNTAADNAQPPARITEPGNNTSGVNMGNIWRRLLSRGFLCRGYVVVGIVAIIIATVFSTIAGEPATARIETMRHLFDIVWVLFQMIRAAFSDD